jgi:hypothetical protein
MNTIFSIRVKLRVEPANRNHPTLSLPRATLVHRFPQYKDPRRTLPSNYPSRIQRQRRRALTIGPAVCERVSPYGARSPRAENAARERRDRGRFAVIIISERCMTKSGFPHSHLITDPFQKAYTVRLALPNR